MNQIELNIKKDIGDLIISIGEGKFTEKAKDLLTNQFKKGCVHKEHKINTENEIERQRKLALMISFLEDKKAFYLNDTISELLSEIEWVIKNEILNEEKQDKIKKDENNA